jgi:PAS domain S-box-containing protein
MTLRGPRANVEVPALPLTDYVFEHASRHWDKTAIVDGPTGRTLTYGELINLVRRTAAGLVAHGLQKGGVCAIHSPNIPEYVAAFYAVAAAGGIVTTTNPLYNAAELAHQLSDSSASLLVSTQELLATGGSAAIQAGVREIFVVGDGSDIGACNTPVVATRFEALSDFGEGVAIDTDAQRDLVVLPYSSGTSGMPKGVMLTHRNIVANIAQIEAAEGIAADEIVIGTLPFYHIYGMVVVMGMALRAGATIVTLPRFDVRAFLETIQNYRVTTAYLVPPIVRTLAKHPLVEQFDLSSLRYVQSGAAALPEQIALECAERHDCVVTQAYGLTETSSVTHLTPRDAIRIGAVGVPLPNTDFRIVDVADRSDVTVGELGEVWLRGPQVMKGYLNNPDATAGMIEADGWLRSGDIGYADKDGYLYVLDRAKELVKFRGLQYDEHEILFAMLEDVRVRKQTRERLAFQALLLDSVRESVIATDADHLVTSWNKGAEALFGYSTEEAIGRSVTDLILPNDKDVRRSRKQELEALRTHGKWHGRVLRRRKDGSRIWTDLAVSTVMNGDHATSGYVTIHRDVTEEEAFEQRLRFQAQLLDSVQESVIAVDLDGNVVFWGRGAESLFGYRADEVTGRYFEPFTMSVSGDERDSIRALRKGVLENGVWRAQRTRRRKNGSEFLADIVAAPVRDNKNQLVGLIAIHRDISDLRRNEEMLQDSRERLRNLASSLMAVREQERSSLSRELHDQLGQALTRLKIDVCWIRGHVPKRMQGTKRVESMVTLVDSTIETVQHISAQLRPAILDDLGLEAAIEWQAQEFSDWNGCRCTLDLRIGDLKPNRDRDTAIFRILQECLTNVARHAHATSVTVKAEVRSPNLILRVEDDGIGIPESKLTSCESLGLIGMRERVEVLNGKLDFVARRPQGTVVSARVPIEDLES